MKPGAWKKNSLFPSSCSGTSTFLPESCFIGSTPQPAKPINTVCMISPSACLVYIVCSRLRPKETLTFHTQGSSPSLSRIIVQLTSQSQPIMWEEFFFSFLWEQHRNRSTSEDDETGCFPVKFKHPYSFITLGWRGLFIEETCVGDRGGVVQPLCHESTTPLILWPPAPTSTNSRSTLEFKGCLWSCL